MAATAVMGNYEVISDTRTPDVSLRLLKVGPGQEVDPHFHRRTTQVYLVLKGTAGVRVDGGVLELHALESARLPPFTVHGLSASKPALVLSISVPPLDAEDEIVA